MAECPLLANCIFFNDRMAQMPKTAEMMKSRFCKNDNSHCARFIVCTTLGKDKVPSDLFPGEIEVARVIIGKK
ncbi:MAG: hypothetical protein PHN57_01710 [Candidatus Omnitrophica bacterium]|nr:hypothetical protein [Candidatus Omnitrophota bacterium]